MAGFWSTNNIEPKRNYRFMVQFTGLAGPGEPDVLYWAKTTGVPNYTVTSVTHDFLDNKYHFPGRVEWQDISMTLVDPISPNAVAQVNKLIEKSGYVVPAVAPPMPSAGGDVKLQTVSKIKEGSKTAGHSSTVVDGGALGDIIVSVMDSNGKKVEEWTLKNPLIMSAKYGDLDYSNDELKTVEIGLKYDWAECNTFDTSHAPLSPASTSHFAPKS